MLIIAAIWVPYQVFYIFSLTLYKNLELETKNLSIVY